MHPTLLGRGTIETELNLPSTGDKCRPGCTSGIAQGPHLSEIAVGDADGLGVETLVALLDLERELGVPILNPFEADHA